MVEDISFLYVDMKTFLKLAVASALTTLLAVTAFTGSFETQTPVADAAQADYYLKIDGIDGEIQIESWSWGITSPRDNASGLATGKRQHEPLIIRKRIDKSTPLLYKLATAGAKTGHVTLLKRTDGQETYKVVFQDIIISSYENKGDVGGDAEILSFSWGASQMGSSR